MQEGLCWSALENFTVRVDVEQARSKPAVISLLLEMHRRAFLPNWTQNPSFFAELTQ